MSQDKPQPMTPEELHSLRCGNHRYWDLDRLLATLDQLQAQLAAKDYELQQCKGMHQTTLELLKDNRDALEVAGAQLATMKRNYDHLDFLYNDAIEARDMYKGSVEQLQAQLTTMKTRLDIAARNKIDFIRQLGAVEAQLAAILNISREQRRHTT